MELKLWQPLGPLRRRFWVEDRLHLVIRVACRQLWLERRAAFSKIGDKADARREAVRTGEQGHYECCFEDGLVIPAVLA